MLSLIQRFEQVNDILINTRLQLLPDPQIGVNAFYKRLHDSGAIRAWAQFQKIGKLEGEIEYKLRTWTQRKNPSPEPVNFNTVQAQDALIKKVRIFKLTFKIMCVALVILTSVYVLSIPILLLSAPILLPKILIISLSISCSISCCLLFTTGLMMRTEKLFREKRINVSLNFKGFVRRYLIDRIQFVPSKKDLLDSQLHNIYSNWKKEAKSLLQH